MDIWSKQKRSQVMSKIRGKNTKPEMLLRSRIFRDGFRYRIHVNNLPGKPDIVLPKYKTVIFVHGCFWHYHRECKEGRIPPTNTVFWHSKLQRNVERDDLNNEALKKMGWNVIIVWECEIEKQLESVFEKIIKSFRR